jgi:hypothetical protein
MCAASAKIDSMKTRYLIYASEAEDLRHTSAGNFEIEHQPQKSRDVIPGFLDRTLDAEELGVVVPLPARDGRFVNPEFLRELQLAQPDSAAKPLKFPIKCVIAVEDFVQERPKSLWWIVKRRK